MTILSKYLLPLIVMLSAFSARAAEEAIIDPSLMNKGVWAEPIFPGPDEEAPVLRTVASADSKWEKNPSQYIDVLKKIPVSEPTLHQSWIEHSILNEH